MEIEADRKDRRAGGTVRVQKRNAEALQFLSFLDGQDIEHSRLTTKTKKQKKWKRSKKEDKEKSGLHSFIRCMQQEKRGGIQHNRKPKRSG